MTFDFNSLIEPNMEVGTIIGYRFWKYRLTTPPMLGSWVSSLMWYPNKDVEATHPDFDEQGIHAYKTFEGLQFYMGEPMKLVDGYHMTWPFTDNFGNPIYKDWQWDGIVVGSVELWGVVHQHKLGYRAQYARPKSFISAHGRDVEAIYKLREAFFGKEVH